MRRCTPVVFVLLSLVVVGVPVAYAQGGGASQTGTILGKVSDSSEAALPGVTVTITSASLMGTQTQVTNESGLYRFPAVPPGSYTIKYDLAGFSTLVREQIDVSLGFTATVNVQLAVATLQETVTVTGESPVVDTSATRVQQNFKLEQLQTIPNARDMWSLLAVSPAVVMQRIDVGGNRAGTQTTYNAYGYNGQVRVLVEGINTTEGTGGAGFYFDYGSFEEVFLGTAGQGAEMPNPGVQSQFLGKSGGNNFQGEIYLDYENNSMQGSNLEGNIPERWVYDPVTNPSGIRLGSNEIDGYRDFNINVGGPIKRDKVWWYFSYRDQKNQVAQPNFRFDKTFDTELWNVSGKGTYQVNQNNKLTGYYQWGQKIQPNRLPVAAAFYNTPDDTWRQDSGSWVYKGEWNSTISDRLYVEARYGDFGYYFPLVANSPESNTYYWRDTTLNELSGGDDRWQLDRDRKQATAAATYFKDNFLGGNHSFKFGGEVLLEKGYEGYLQSVDGHIEHRFANNNAQQVIFDFPTATEVEELHAWKNDIKSIAKLDHFNLFLSDQYHRWPGYAERRTSLRSLQGAHPRAGPDGVRDLPGVRNADRHHLLRSSRVLRLSDDDDLELRRAADRPGLRPVRRREDRAEGELRALQAQPGRDARVQREPEPAVEDGHVQLARSEQRPAVPDRRAGGCADRQRACRCGDGRSEHQAAVFARGERVLRAGNRCRTSAAASGSSTRRMTICGNRKSSRRVRTACTRSRSTSTTSATTAWPTRATTASSACSVSRLRSPPPIQLRRWSRPWTGPSGSRPLKRRSSSG